MQFTIHTRALALLLLIVPTFGGAGGALATWPLTLILAVARDGWAGIDHIPIEWGVIANLPKWVYAGNRFWGTLGWLAYSAEVLAGFCYFGLLGGRLWGWLVIKRFRWMTEEQVREFSNQEPRN